MGFSSLASSANHHILAASFHWILATSTWFLSGIWAAFIRFVVSISHCSVSNDFSVPKNTAGCSFLNSESFPGLYSRGAINNPWSKISVCFCWFSIRLFMIPINPTFSLVWPPWEKPESSDFSYFHVRVGLKIAENWETKGWKSFRTLYFAAGLYN